MSKCYNLDGIKTDWKKELDRCQALKEAWEKVTFPTKKDGTPFKVMSKNINGAHYEPCQYMTYGYEYRVRVTTHSNLSGYVSDEFNTYDNVRYINDVKRAKIDKNIVKSRYGLADMYVFDLDDIKESVKEKIEYYTKQIEKIECDLSNVDVAFNEFEKAYRGICVTLSKRISKYNATDIKDTITDEYRYSDFS